MLSIKSEPLSNTRSLIGKCIGFTKLLRNILLKRGTSMHIYSDSYSPVPRDWSAMPGGNVYESIISRNRDAYFQHLKHCSKFMSNLKSIPIEQPADNTEPFWGNPYFSPFDSLILYSLIAQKNPAIYMEIGSGNSTKYVRRAIKDHQLDTKIISIDPYPRAEIDSICDENIRMRAEAVPIEKFLTLKCGDILFIDNSHRSFQNSDVTVFFTEILPNLKAGVIYGIHDIFLPCDYPETWTMRFYNEQYLLMSYLLGGAGGDEILFPVAYMSHNDAVANALLGEPAGIAPWGAQPLHGGAFWMVKA